MPFDDTTHFAGDGCLEEALCQIDGGDPKLHIGTPERTASNFATYFRRARRPASWHCCAGDARRRAEFGVWSTGGRSAHCARLSVGHNH